MLFTITRTSRVEVVRVDHIRGGVDFMTKLNSEDFMGDVFSDVVMVSLYSKVGKMPRPPEAQDDSPRHTPNSGLSN